MRHNFLKDMQELIEMPDRFIRMKDRCEQLEYTMESITILAKGERPVVKGEYLERTSHPDSHGNKVVYVVGDNELREHIARVLKVCREKLLDA